MISFYSNSVLVFICVWNCIKSISRIHSYKDVIISSYMLVEVIEKKLVDFFRELFLNKVCAFWDQIHFQIWNKLLNLSTHCVFSKISKLDGIILFPHYQQIWYLDFRVTYSIVFQPCSATKKKKAMTMENDIKNLPFTPFNNLHTCMGPVMQWRNLIFDIKLHTD